MKKETGKIVTRRKNKVVFNEDLFYISLGVKKVQQAIRITPDCNLTKIGKKGAIAVGDIFQCIEEQLKIRERAAYELKGSRLNDRDYARIGRTFCFGKQDKDAIEQNILSMVSSTLVTKEKLAERKNHRKGSKERLAAKKKAKKEARKRLEAIRNKKSKDDEEEEEEEEGEGKMDETQDEAETEAEADDASNETLVAETQSQDE